MSATPDIPVQHACDPVVVRAERQMRMMAQLSEIGLGLARRLQEEVCGGASVTMLGDVALMYSRIARTVRQCIALEVKIDAALREWLALSEAERAERRAVAGAQASEPKASGAPAVDEAEAETLVEIERGSREWRGETERGERAERFWADSYVIEDEGSFVEIVAKVCRDLGVTPDWSAWAEDGPEDLAVKPDGASGFWRGDGPGLAPGIGPAGRLPPQRGPPS
jgi:hypothetical protein